MIHDYGKLIFNTFFQKDTNALLDKIMFLVMDNYLFESLCPNS